MSYLDTSHSYVNSLLTSSAVCRLQCTVLLTLDRRILGHHPCKLCNGKKQSKLVKTIVKVSPKFSLNFPSSSLVIVFIISIFNHPCSFIVYYYLSGVFPSYKLLFLAFLQFKGKSVRSQNNAKYRDRAPSSNFSQ